MNNASSPLYSHRRMRPGPRGNDWIPGFGGNGRARWERKGLGKGRPTKEFP